MSEKNPSVCESKEFEAIFKSYSKSLRNFIYYKSGDLDQSEDLVQEAFVKLWNNCSKVSIEKAKSFLYTVTNNAFLNEVAHKKVVLTYQKQSHKSYTHESPEYLLEEKQYSDKLQNAIANLPDKQRVVFLMNRIDKMSYKEIADTLELSVKAIEKRMHLALLALRTTIVEI
jgi:RNA polymerase sigma-70 factor (family 1)